MIHIYSSDHFSYYFHHDFNILKEFNKRRQISGSDFIITCIEDIDYCLSVFKRDIQYYADINAAFEKLKEVYSDIKKLQSIL